jgi:transcriptional regulator GlxA family with amidase domain
VSTIVRTRRVGILLFDQVEILDAAGPFEVFSVASRMHEREQPRSAPLFEVFAVASAQRVVARHGLQMLPSFALGAHPPIDVLIVPGGVVRDAQRDARIVSWIAEHGATCEVLASVCTGAFLLAQAGLLHGAEVTTHWEDLSDLQLEFPSLRVIADRRWTRNDRVWTSAGISAGIDMSLSIVAALSTEALALRTARQMDYRWQRDPQSPA